MPGSDWREECSTISRRAPLSCCHSRPQFGERLFDGSNAGEAAGQYQSVRARIFAALHPRRETSVIGKVGVASPT